MAPMRKPHRDSPPKGRKRGRKPAQARKPAQNGPSGRDSGGTAERPAAPKAARRAEAGLWLYGQHAVLAALANPKRRCSRLLATAEAREKLDQGPRGLLGRRADGLRPEPAGREDLAALLPPAAVHQGLALAVEPLAQPSLAELLGALADSPPAAPRRVICALDHVTDPQNVGAILRSAAAFGAAGLLTTRRNAAPESGALAKAASGALERVPYLQVGNLAQALESLKNDGFWVMGLASEGSETLPLRDPGERLALVLGAEGEGLRRLTRERCDLLLRLPTRPPLDQLNVSNAAAIAFYELLGRPSP